MADRINQKDLPPSLNRPFSEMIKYAINNPIYENELMFAVDPQIAKFIEKSGVTITFTEAQAHLSELKSTFEKTSIEVLLKSGNISQNILDQLDPSNPTNPIQHEWEHISNLPENITSSSKFVVLAVANENHQVIGFDAFSKFDQGKITDKEMAMCLAAPQSLSTQDRDQALEFSKRTKNPFFILKMKRILKDKPIHQRPY